MNRDKFAVSSKVTKPANEQPLFRAQVLNARRGQWLGPVVLASPLSYSFYALLALIVTTALVTFAVFGEFTRKARINGWLVPAEGMIRVFVQQPGVVVAIKVKEGSSVLKGAPLVVLSGERQSSVVGATQAEITRLLGARRSSLQNEISQQENLLRQQSAALNRRLEAIRGEMDQFSREISLQSTRTELARSSAERLSAVEKIGGASRMEIERQQENELEQRGRLRQLERTRAERQRELVTLKAELDDLPIKART